jgi:vacuolar-type H+-ATPase subunit I/STV1
MPDYPEDLTDSQLIERLTTVVDDLLKEIKRLNEELDKKDANFRKTIEELKPTIVFEYCEHCKP